MGIAEKMTAVGFAGPLWQRLWPRPGVEASLPRRMFWGIFRVVAIFCREFQRDNIPLRSSALTFTIVLSLVPTLALGTAVLKGLGAGDQMREAAYRLVDQIEGGAPGSVAESPTKSQDNATSGQVVSAGGNHTVNPAAPRDTELNGHLHLAVAKIFDYVDRTNFAALGAFGIIGLVIAVLSVLGRIEQAVNVIWQVNTGRNMSRRLMDYLALMILLPICVNLGFAAEAMLRNETIFKMVNNLLPVAGLSRIFSILPMLVVIITFAGLYRFLPNIKVRILPALVGGVVGGISWFLIQTFYVKLQIGVARYNAIYGSFATLPLFLLWLNIAWLVFLSGAEVSFACQVFRDYEWHPPKLSPYNSLAMAFDLLDEIFID
ncbi:MAG: YihY/virulence factor BrkB family protein, partial [Deltaproteobacteria bacterium]|nr:YihY/virulence factor BrkB family protein [Deltaproteobacteria bacterium]